jgi:hypothetical protein
MLHFQLSLLVAVFSLPSALSSSPPKRLSRYGCEGSELQLACAEPGAVIRPVRANYGRFSIQTCNPAGTTHGWSTRCIQPTSLRRVSALCAGQRACTIDVTSAVFGDPCPDTYKYLEVHYTCVRPTESATTHGDERTAAAAAEDNLPPWLLKMTATSTSPPPVSTTTADVAKTTGTAVAASTENAAEEKKIRETIGLLMPDVIVLDGEEEEEDVYEIQEVYRNNEDEEAVFINLPHERMDVVEEVVVVQNTEEKEVTVVVVATLVSLLCCCSVILVAAGLLLNKHHRRQAARRGGNMMLDNSSLDSSSSTQYRPPYTIPMPINSSAPMDDWYEYCSNSSYSSYSSSSSIKTTIYTTLPNGQLAVVIPMASNSSHSSLLNSVSSYGHNQKENYYVEVGHPKDLLRY